MKEEITDKVVLPISMWMEKYPLAFLPISEKWEDEKTWDEKLSPNTDGTFPMGLREIMDDYGYQLVSRIKSDINKEEKVLIEFSVIIVGKEDVEFERRGAPSKTIVEAVEFCLRLLESTQTSEIVKPDIPKYKDRLPDQEWKIMENEYGRK